MRAIKVHTFQKEKYTLVFGAFILGFTLLAGRLCYLMIFRSEELSKKALNIEQRERTIKAARGKIYDRNGIVLADNQAVCSVSVILSDKRTTKGNKTTVAKACSFGRGSKKEGRKGIFERKNKE